MVPRSVPNASTVPHRKRVDEADDEALRFLERRIAPLLAKDRNPPLLRSVRAAIGTGSLDFLGTLPERQRRDLLGAIERALEERRVPPAPRAIVRLTSVVSAAPGVDDRSGRRLAPPAR